MDLTHEKSSLDSSFHGHNVWFGAPNDRGRKRLNLRLLVASTCLTFRSNFPSLECTKCYQASLLLYPSLGLFASPRFQPRKLALQVIFGIVWRAHPVQPGPFQHWWTNASVSPVQKVDSGPRKGLNPTRNVCHAHRARSPKIPDHQTACYTREDLPCSWLVYPVPFTSLGEVYPPRFKHYIQ